MMTTTAALACALMFHGISVSASLDHTKVQTGREIRCTVMVESGTAYEIAPPPPAAFLSSFVIKDMNRNEKKGENTKTVKWEYVLAAFGTGKSPVPALPVSYVDPAGRAGMIYTRELPLFVESVTVSTGDKPADIKDIMTLPALAWPWIVLAAVLAAVAGVWMFLRRRSTSIVSHESETVLPPWDRALAELDELAESERLENGDVMGHTVICSEILRRYLGLRFNFPAMEMPSDDLAVRLGTEHDLDRGVLDQVETMLHDMDLVKFAKADASAPRSWPGIIRDVVLFTRHSAPGDKS